MVVPCASAAHARYIDFASLLRPVMFNLPAITLLHVYHSRPIIERIALSRGLSTSPIVGILEGDVLLFLVDNVGRFAAPTALKPPSSWFFFVNG